MLSSQKYQRKTLLNNAETSYHSGSRVDRQGNLFPNFYHMPPLPPTSPYAEEQRLKAMNNHFKPEKAPEPLKEQRITDNLKVEFSDFLKMKLLLPPPP
jgi:hypothetical protein